MIAQKMEQSIEDLLKRLAELGIGAAKGTLSVSLMWTEHLVRKYKEDLKNHVDITVDKVDLKEYDLAFKEVGLKYKLEQLEGVDQVKLMVRSTPENTELYKKALELIEKSRYKLNEKSLTEFMDEFKDVDLMKRGPLDDVEVDRFKDYANMGDLDYSVFKQKGKFGIVFKESDSLLVEELMEKTQADLIGLNGPAERRKVEMQLAAIGLSRRELNKIDTNFVVVDASHPEDHLVVLEDTWELYNGELLVNQFEAGGSAQHHRDSVLKRVQTLKSPLIMSKEEYDNVEVRNELVKESGYIEQKQGPELPNLREKIIEKVSVIKSEKVTLEEKQTVKVVEVGETPKLKDRVRDREKARAKDKPLVKEEKDRNER